MKTTGLSWVIIGELRSEDFYQILKPVHDKDRLHAGSKKTFSRVESLYACAHTSQGVWLEQGMKLCDTCSLKRLSHHYDLLSRFKSAGT